ncbi:MAG: hypothetical protein QOI80_2276 [Solirubrobacteraceae bacterium]|nr:hypothetical protein [Solirubrobacteraceae bacterium]
MVIVTHSPAPHGWEFQATRGNLQGGGRTLAESVDSAEHAARLFLNDVQGYTLLHEDARRRVRHAISCVPV